MALAVSQPQLAGLVYLPYAEWLASTDEFELAQDAFKKAGKHEQVIYVHLYMSVYIHIYIYIILHIDVDIDIDIWIDI